MARWTSIWGQGKKYYALRHGTPESPEDVLLDRIDRERLGSSVAERRPVKSDAEGSTPSPGAWDLTVQELQDLLSREVER